MEAEIHAPHKFERNKKVAKTIKCFVCSTYISSAGSTCTICDVSVHKSCAVRVRDHNCPILEKELTQAFSPETSPSIGPKTSGDLPSSLSNSSPAHTPSSPSLSLGTPLNNGNLEIFFSDGSSKSISYHADITLLTILNQIREERGDGTYTVYDKTGKLISNYDQTLKKIRIVFPLFFSSVETSSKTGKKPKPHMRLSAKRKKPTNNGSVGDIKPSISSPQLAKNKTKVIQQSKKFSKKPFIDISYNVQEESTEMMEQRHGTMSITVISVTDLANQTSAYKLLYFTLTNLENGQRHRSQLLENNANPTWNQTIKFHMPYAFGQWNIKIWAVKKIDTGADLLLGEADFVLKGFQDGDCGMKTLVLKKEDSHKKEKDKKLKKIQFDSLQLENMQLRQEIEDGKKEREGLRNKLEEAHKQIALMHDAHLEEMKSFKDRIQRDVASKNPDLTTVTLLQEEIEVLKGELKATRTEFQQFKLKEEEVKKNYEEQIEYLKSQVEGGKKNAKVSLQWSYQDRKLKNPIMSTLSSSSLDVPPSSIKKMEWTPSKSRGKSNTNKGGFLSRGGALLTKTQSDDSTSIPSLVASNDLPSLSTSPLTKKEKKKRIQEVYDIGEVLGTGGSSVVREGIHRETGQKVAIKILDNYDNVEDASDEEEAFWAEIEIIRQLDHPCVLNVYDFYEDNEHYYVVLELLAGNELFDQIIEKGSYSEPEAVSIIFQVLLALDHLASKSICHLDLKPENILFTDDTHTRIKLIDFGEASSCKDHKLTGWVGTNNYMAPEMIKHLEYDTKVDMWSLGVVAYIMLCGSFAFDAEDEMELYQDIMEMRYEFRSPEWDDVSDDAKSFVTSLLTGPLERLSASEALRHRWIKNNLRHLPESVRALASTD